jgi:carbon dioxide concentrating mechanism protein CcmN
MSLQSSPSLHHSEICVIGDVQVDPLAVIAPGVVLYAEPGSQIHIAAGVCIGIKSVLHISQGSLTIETGVNLAAGVLIVGSGRIGQTTCIGAGTTLIQPEIPAGQVIPPGSLLGDGSRQVDLELDSAAHHPDQGADQEENIPYLGNGFSSTAPVETPPETRLEPQVEPQTVPPELGPEQSSDPSPVPNRRIYGQDYVKQMMGKMFPNHSG